MKSQSLAGMTPPLQHPLQAWQPHSLPRARAKDRARPSLSPLRPSRSPRASRSITAASRLFCLQATATQACLTTPGCPVLSPVLPLSSTAPPCLFLLGARDQPQPSSTTWASAWETHQLAPSSSRHSSSLAVMASTPSAQVSISPLIIFNCKNNYRLGNSFDSRLTDFIVIFRGKV